MHFATAAIFVAGMGSAIAIPAELSVRQEQKSSAVLVCTDGTFADARATMVNAVCITTYGCEGGTAPFLSSGTWTGGCVGCPRGQNANKFGNCLFSYI
ncbi:hypothetical protein FDECE_17050 [Fusarium decemcellulare]|nr:hypothetical protein FDECE_17050 [Fusarium decemcellulare]